MEKKQTKQTNRTPLIVLSILLVIVVLASACYFTLGGAEKKKDKAVQNIEAALAQDNFKKARKTLSEIPSSFSDVKQEYEDKINIREVNSLMSEGKEQEAGELFVKSCSSDNFFAENVATAIALCDNNFIENRITGYKLNEVFSSECRDCDPNDIDEKKNNYVYNEEVKKYNNLIDAIFYAAINENDLTMAQKCLTYYMPIAKESSRTENSSYSTGHYDLTYEEDYYSRDDAQKSMEKLVKVKSYEQQLNSMISSKGKSALNANGLAILNGLVKYMKENPSLRVKVTAHTNAKSRKNKNIELSKEQAEAVVRYLTEKGVPAIQLQSEGLGDEGFENNKFSKALGDTYLEFTIISQ